MDLFTVLLNTSSTTTEILHFSSHYVVQSHSRSAISVKIVILYVTSH